MGYECRLSADRQDAAVAPEHAARVMLFQEEQYESISNGGGGCRYQRR
jgi:hypothetical protein